MRRVFADTSALIALRDAGDANHDAAVSWLAEALAGPPLRLVLTHYVLAEVHGFFCRNPGIALAYAEKLRLEPVFQIVRPTPGDEREAWAILRRSGDKTYSFVDAVSFAVMSRLRLPEALAFDAHFRQHARFRALP